MIDAAACWASSIRRPCCAGGEPENIAHTAGLLADTPGDPDDYLDGLIERMTRANVAHIPVISPEDGRLVGYIGCDNLMKVRARLHAERDRVVSVACRR